jgi:hypothetical protein
MLGGYHPFDYKHFMTNFIVTTAEEKPPLPAEMAVVLEEIRKEIRRSASPWLNRKAAADYALCSTALIDDAAAKGLIKRHYFQGSTRFKKSDIDASIEAGALRRARAKQQQR